VLTGLRKEFDDRTVGRTGTSWTRSGKQAAAAVEAALAFRDTAAG